MTILNFKCKKCNKEFDFNVGKVSNFVNKRFSLDNCPACPICGNTEESNIILSDKNTPKLQKLLNNEARKKAIRMYRPGELMCYEAIFGGSEILLLSFKEIDYKIADYYCVTPLCDCKEAVLHAFYAHSGLDNPLWKIAYDYQLKKITECEDISEDDANEIINKLKEFDNDLFLKRHSIIKRELRYPLHNKFFKNKKSPIKIGRNEPCPCGSGKKYKKCCLDKEGKQK